MTAKTKPVAYTWKCPACGVSGQIEQRSWMNGNEKAKWGLAVLDDVLREHDEKSPACGMKDLEIVTPSSRNTSTQKPRPIYGTSNGSL